MQLSQTKTDERHKIDGITDAMSLESFEPRPAPHELVEVARTKRHPREGWPKWRWPCVMLFINLLFLLIGYDSSNVANVQAPVYRAFGHVELLPWMALGASAGTFSIVLVIRRLFILTDVRYVLSFFSILLGIGSALSGAASNMETMIIGRFITGAGIAGCYQCGYIYTVSLNTAEEFPKNQSQTAIVWAVGLILGPIVGAAFAQNSNATWRWAFYINLPIIALLLGLVLAVLPPIRLDPKRTMAVKLLSIDWVGAFLHAAFVVIFCCALITSGPTSSWDSALSISTWVLTGVIAVSYLLQQYFCVFTEVDRRILPLNLLNHRSIALCALATCCAGSVYGVTLYYTPLLFAFTRQLSPLSASVHLLPFIGTFIGLTFITGGSLPRVRFYAPYYILGGLLVAIGGGLLTSLTQMTSMQKLMGYQVIVGAGAGLIFQTGITPMLQLAPDKINRTDIMAFFISSQFGGISISLAIASCIFENIGTDRLRTAIGEWGFSDEGLQEALAGVDSPLLENENAAIVSMAVEATTYTLSGLFWIVTAAGIVAFLCGCLMKFERLPFSEPHSTELPSTKDEPHPA